MKLHKNPFFPPLLVSIALLLVMGLGSCKEDIEDTNNIVLPSKNVSYTKNVEPLFQQACSFSGCHDSEARAGGYSMETWDEVRNSIPGIIRAGDTLNSVFSWSLTGKNNQTRMPFNRPPLNANQIHGINVWIMEGAQFN